MSSMKVAHQETQEAVKLAEDKYKEQEERQQSLMSDLEQQVGGCVNAVENWWCLNQSHSQTLGFTNYCRRVFDLSTNGGAMKYVALC